MDKTTIAIGIVLLVIVVGVAFVASRSPTAQSALGFGPAEVPGRDYTAQDAAAIIEASGGAVQGLLTGIASFTGGGLGAAASGRSGAGVK